MSEVSVIRKSIAKLDLWEKISQKRVPVSFELEITSRCNNDCRHCYINLNASDKNAEKKELSIREIDHIAEQAVKMGSLWCLITGGEPLLRKDFSEIYIMLKKKGLLVSVFTNGCLINEDHITLFKKYPPKEIEITVYGVTEKTYEAVSRKHGTFRSFTRGLNLLRKNNINIRLKAVAIRSNFHELEEIAEFCREGTKDYFRFDPMLHLRFDRDEKRNREIKDERLTAEEIVKIEQNDPERSVALKNNCDQFIFEGSKHERSSRIFFCGAGQSSFTVSSEGIFRLCSSLWHPDFIYDLRKGNLKDAWESFVPGVLNYTSDNQDYLNKCRTCNIINLCLWCPAHADLETGSPDSWVEYFCGIAHARKDAIKKG